MMTITDCFQQSICPIPTHLLQLETLRVLVLSTLIQIYMFNRQTVFQMINLEKSALAIKRIKKGYRLSTT